MVNSLGVGFFNELRLQHHFSYLIHSAIDVVIAIDDAVDFEFGANFYHC